MKKTALILTVIILFSSFSVVASNNPTRLECIRFVVNNSSLDYSSHDTLSAKSFAETEELEEYDKKLISAAIDNGIIKGYEDNTLRFNQNVTRAEFACMIYRAKEFYTPCVDIVSYNGNYTDLADWNKTEIVYCMESGFLMGYGNMFGSADSITHEQMQIVVNRLKYGLTTNEKYALMNICGTCPIPYDAMLYSAYDESFSSVVLKENGLEEDTNAVKQTTAKTLIDMLDKIGNLDYEKLADKDYEDYQKDVFLYEIPPTGPAEVDPETGLFVVKINKVPYEINLSGEATNIEKILQSTKDNKIKRESMHVLAPENTYEGRLYSAFRMIKGCGYEYFMYKEGAAPEGIEPDVWYKRSFTIAFQKDARIARPHRLVVTYGTDEKFQ